MELYASRRLHDEMDRRCGLFAIQRKPMPAVAEIAPQKAHRRCPVMKLTGNRLMAVTVLSLAAFDWKRSAQAE